MELKKIYLVWSTIQSILIKHSMYIKRLPNPFERPDALIEGKQLRLFHLVMPCYCLAWKTLYLVDRKKGDFCERLSTHMYFNILSVCAWCRYTTVISSLVLPPTPPVHSYYGIACYLYSFFVVVVVLFFPVITCNKCRKALVKSIW